MTDCHLRGELGTLVADAIADAVADDEEDGLVLCDQYDVLCALIEALASDDAHGRIRLLTNREIAKRAKREFFVATRLVDLVTDDRLALGVVDAEPVVDSVFVGSTAAVQLLTTLSEDAFGNPIEDEGCLDELRDTFEPRWDRADDYPVNAPAYSYILESASVALGDDIEEGLAKAFAETSARSGRATVDVADLVLVLAAKYDEQFYEVSKWAEETGVGSRAKFSQAKRRLEDLGLLATEAIPTETVGRPRQQLVLAHDDLAGASVTELVAALQSVGR